MAGSITPDDADDAATEEAPEHCSNYIKLFEKLLRVLKFKINTSGPSSLSSLHWGIPSHAL